MSGPGSHSPVGASSVKTRLACPASLKLAEGIEDEESEYAAEGTAVHALIEACFLDNTDAWMKIGLRFENYTVDRKMANAAQVMLDAVRKAHPDRNQGNFWVERRFHCPTIHPLFFGTSDVIHVDTTEINQDGITTTWTALHVWDYKNGAGVVIEVEGNDQASYYACGALEDLALWNKVDEVVLHIVQPNGFHADGPVRQWTTTPDALAAWMEDTLLPGIARALGDTHPLDDAHSGEHCRFCPARSHACPRLMKEMDELEAMLEQVKGPGAEALTNEQVGRFLELVDRAKIVGKAALSTASVRITAGGRIPGWKLVKAKSNRVWKDDVEAAAKAKFGEDALTKPELKSPAMIDDLPMGKAFTTEHAFKPEGELTLTRSEDNRAEVSTDTKALFQDVTKLGVPELTQDEVAAQIAALPVRRRTKAA